jgi:hypothetical protein
MIGADEIHRCLHTLEHYILLRDSVFWPEFLPKSNLLPRKGDETHRAIIRAEHEMWDGDA